MTKTKKILILEKIANGTLKNENRESCLFGTSDFYFPIKDTQLKITGPYDFMFYALPYIPENLDRELHIIPYVPGSVKNDETTKRIRELKEKFPFIEDFALTGKGKYTETYRGQKEEKQGIFLKIIKFKKKRPVAEYPKRLYELYKVDIEELEQETINAKFLINHIAEKIKQIETNYRNPVA